jgi:hypothetical protein
VSRNGIADLLKGLAVLFMIQVHVMEQFGSQELFDSLVGQASMFLGGPACAPVFLAVMGYFLAGGEKSLMYYLKRGALLFAGGILLNVLRSANLLVRIMAGTFELDPWPFIFGVDILPLAGISLILIGFLRKLLGTQPWGYLLLAILIAFISPYVVDPVAGKSVVNYGRAFFTGAKDWSYFPVLPWISYILTGVFFRMLLVRIPKLPDLADDARILLIIIPAGIMLVLTLPWASSITHNLEGIGSYYHHGIEFFGWVAMFFVPYLLLVRQIELSTGGGIVARAIKWTGRHVTLVYVVQWLIIGNLATVLYKSQSLFGYLAWFAGIVVLTMIIARGKLWIQSFFHGSANR